MGSNNIAWVVTLTQYSVLVCVELCRHGSTLPAQCSLTRLTLCVLGAARRMSTRLAVVSSQRCSSRWMVRTGHGVFSLQIVDHVMKILYGCIAFTQCADAACCYRYCMKRGLCVGFSVRLFVGHVWAVSCAETADQKSRCYWGADFCGLRSFV